MSAFTTPDSDRKRAEEVFTTPDADRNRASWATPVKDMAKGMPAPSQTEAGLRSFANAATFGLAPKISALANTGLGKIAPDTFGNEDYATRLKDYLAANRASAESHPGTTLAAGLVPNAIQAFATGGGSLARQAGVNAAMGAVDAYGNSEQTNPLNSTVLTGGATAGALSAAPGLVGKGFGRIADAFSRKTIGGAVQKADDLLVSNTHKAQDAAAKVLGQSGPTFRKDGVKVKDYVDTVRDNFLKGRKNSLDLEMSDLGGDLATPILKANTPTLNDVMSGAWGTTKTGATGAGAAGVVNYASGSELDPLSAMAMGGAAGAFYGSKDVAKNLAMQTAHKISTSQMPQKIWNAAGSRAGGAVSQLGIQAGTRDIVDETTEGGNPFGKLSDYFTGLKPDEKRRAAMEMSQDPESRAIGNEESPLNR